MLKLPSSPITDFLILLLYLLPDLQSIERLQTRNRKLSKGKSAIQFRTDGKMLSAEKKTDLETVHIGIEDYTEIPPPKLIIFLLCQINRLAVSDTNITTHEIEFNIQELVQCGMYKSVTSAKNALTALERVTNIAFRGAVKCEEIRTVNQWSRPIESVEIRKRKAVVKLSPDFPWEVLTRYFMVMPEQVFSLSRRAFILAYYCFFLARQKTAEVKRDGFFSITLRSVQYRLNLPDEEETAHPKALIKKPITETVEEINSLQCGIKLKLFADENADTGSYLDKGKINVHFENSCKSALPDLKKKKKVR